MQPLSVALRLYNMKKLLLSLIFVFTLIAVYSQTNVSGGIYSNTLWSKAISPYIVTDTVVVFPNVIQFKFKEKYGD